MFYCCRYIVDLKEIHFYDFTLQYDTSNSFVYAYRECIFSSVFLSMETNVLLLLYLKQRDLCNLGTI